MACIWRAAKVWPTPNDDVRQKMTTSRLIRCIHSSRLRISSQLSYCKHHSIFSMRLPVTFPTTQKTKIVSSSSTRFLTTPFRNSAINQTRNMASSSDINIENTNIKTASGVSLDDHQKTLVGSVLDVCILSIQVDNCSNDHTAVRRSSIIKEALIMGR